MATTKELKEQGKAWAAARGLKVIPSTGNPKAGKTCCIKVSGGRIQVELHTELSKDSQAHMWAIKRQVGAAIILNVPWSMDMEQGLYDKLTPEQKEEVDGGICGYDYITI